MLQKKAALVSIWSRWVPHKVMNMCKGWCVYGHVHANFDVYSTLRTFQACHNSILPLVGQEIQIHKKYLNLLSWANNYFTTFAYLLVSKPILVLCQAPGLPTSPFIPHTTFILHNCKGMHHWCSICCAFDRTNLSGSFPSPSITVICINTLLVPFCKWPGWALSIHSLLSLNYLAGLIKKSLYHQGEAATSYFLPMKYFGIFHTS